MGLREDALAAAEAAREQRRTTARALLASRLDPAPVDGLTVVDENVQLVVFSDGDGLRLAVRDQVQPPTVKVVTGEPGAWTDARGGDVDSLATLGRVLAESEH